MLFKAPFRVVDIHGHLPYSLSFITKNKVVNEYNKDRSDRMKLTWDFPNTKQETDQNDLEAPLMERWEKELDAYQIDTLNFLTAESNDIMASYIRFNPSRFTGFAYHSIETEDAHLELKRAVEELGLKGYKLFGPLVNKDFHDPSLKKVWTYLADKRLPVLIHFGLLGRAGGIVNHQNISPLSIFQVAREYPEIPIIIPHFGAGYFQELLHLCWSCPNIYIDTSGSNQWVRWMPYHLDLEILFRKTFELIGSKRIIFGTDSNGFPRGYVYRYLQDQVRTCREMNMREDDLENIFGNNARYLLGIEKKDRNNYKRGKEVENEL
ncbi:amidohydrolase family protein [Bacillus gobiensis]|uniref:amidohydrolase family protein n=1 Tax=Bacillus gobiensis TaxID=1441095 RepID=UPI003D1CD5B3